MSADNTDDRPFAWWNSRFASPLPERPSANQVVDHILRNTNDINVVVGPVLWQPGDGASSKTWYFMVATSEVGRGFRADKITSASRRESEEDRERIRFALMQRKPIVIHDTDDELHMARLCETLWPGERITAIRKSIEAAKAPAKETRA